jgi:hypothetical protein
MRTLAQWAIRALALGLIGAGLLGSASRAKADPISFQLALRQLTTTSGGTVTFEGTVTNNSGQDLNASDFFFNFFDFDPVSVNPIQDLGVLTDFSIPTGSTSTLTPLFDVALSTVPTGSIFPIEVQLQDINSNFSEIVTVSVSVPDGSGTGTTVPEPASLLLLAIGAFMICVVHLRRRFVEGLSPR